MHDLTRRFDGERRLLVPEEHLATRLERAQKNAAQPLAVRVDPRPSLAGKERAPGNVMGDGRGTEGVRRPARAQRGFGFMNGVDGGLDVDPGILRERQLYSRRIEAQLADRHMRRKRGAQALQQVAGVNRCSGALCQKIADLGPVHRTAALTYQIRERKLCVVEVEDPVIDDCAGTLDAQPAREVYAHRCDCHMSDRPDAPLYGTRATCERRAVRPAPPSPALDRP